MQPAFIVLWSYIATGKFVQAEILGKLPVGSISYPLSMHFIMNNNNYFESVREFHV